MITVIDYKPEHLAKIDLKECFTPTDRPRTICTKAVTVMNGETVLAIFGAFVFVPGVMHIWGMVSKEVRKSPIGFYKISCKLLAFYEKHEKPRRIQIDIKSGDAELAHWAASLGFQCEGIMRNFDRDGSDCYLYGRVC